MNKLADFLPNEKAESPTAVLLKSLNGEVALFSATSQGLISLFGQQTSSATQFFNEPSTGMITTLQLLASGQLVSGNARGLITVFDLETAKPITTFAKHVTTVTTLKGFHYTGECFVSGSLDTSVRMWDARQKTEAVVMRGHTKAISALDVSPDDAWVISGSEDGFVKFWEANNGSGKCLQEIKADPGCTVSSLCVNPRDIQLAVATSDRSVGFYELERFGFQAKTPVLAGVASQLAYDESGTSLFAAGVGFLKLFVAGSGELVETIEAGWKAPVALLPIGADLYGAARLANGCRLLKLGLNLEKNEAPKKKSSMVIEKEQGPLFPPISRHSNANTNSNNNNNANVVQTELAAIANAPISELMEIEMLRKNHDQFSKNLHDKINALNPIVSFYFAENNMQATKVAVEKIHEPKVITDLLNIFLNTGALANLSVDFATLLLKKAALLFDNKYKFYIKTALRYSRESLRRFHGEIVALKSFSQMSKYDLEREERVKRYDAFLAEIDAITKNRLFGKLVQQFANEEIGELSQQLVADYRNTLDAIKK